MVPKHKSSDVDNFDMPKRNPSTSFDEKLEYSWLDKERKKSYAEVNLHSKNGSSVSKLLRRKKEYGTMRLFRLK